MTRSEVVSICSAAIRKCIGQYEKIRTADGKVYYISTVVNRVIDAVKNEIMNNWDPGSREKRALMEIFARALVDHHLYNIFRMIKHNDSRVWFSEEDYSKVIDEIKVVGGLTSESKGLEKEES